MGVASGRPPWAHIAIMDVIRRPGISDAICLGLLLVVSLAGAVLEPSHRDFWLEFPLLVEIPLLCAALLLIFSRSVAATVIATILHVAILAASGLGLLLSVFLLVTILFAGLAIIMGPVSAILAFNSAYTISRINRYRGLREHASIPRARIPCSD